MSETIHFWDGSTACAEGAILAGLGLFAGYPITPSTAIAERLSEYGLDSRALSGIMLAAVGRGRTNAEIARELFITYATVKSHVSHLLTKLDARDRTQLVVLAHEFGLLG